MTTPLSSFCLLCVLALKMTSSLAMTSNSLSFLKDQDSTCLLSRKFDSVRSTCEKTWSTKDETGERVGHGSTCRLKQGQGSVTFRCVGGNWKQIPVTALVIFTVKRIPDGLAPLFVGPRLQENLDTTPAMDICQVMLDVNDEFPDPPSNESSTICGNQLDGVISKVPSNASFKIQADLNMTLSDFPSYITSSKAGLIETKVTIVIVSLQGNETVFLEQTMNSSLWCNQNVSEESPQDPTNPLDCHGTLAMTNLTLQDGENVCVVLEAISGGFYSISAGGSVGSLQPFQRQSTTERICHLLDESKPVHCSESGCQKLLFELSSRLTRTPEIGVVVDGWLDPIPTGGNANQTSQIARYRLEHAAMDSYTYEWDAGSSPSGGPYNVTVLLPDDNPRLYALLLEVRDNAGNVAYARRLVIYDNSSTVKLNDTGAEINLVSANPRATGLWKTDVLSSLCVDWQNRFYNDKMWDLLNPVVDDTIHEINGQYDQTACLQEQLHDGETYDIWINAIDIMGNHKEDRVRVSIDHTGPIVSIGGLRGRFGRDGLYVHNTTDLSSMLLLVHAADPHSGIKTLEWTVGTHDIFDDVGRGSVRVNRLDNSVSTDSSGETKTCNGTDHCYCPSVGPCEIQQYLFTFTSLGSDNGNTGEHNNTDHSITVTATNHAGLRSRQMMDILIDASPPTVGVVLEGLSDDDEDEMDFTRSRVVHVRWHGFLDHESGILLYRVVLADRCLTDQEMDSSNATEIEDGNTTTLTFPSEGRYFTSLVAYNGAMEPSGVACSDGIFYFTER
ncbi:hypothetical protein BaRGS_00015065, partial [Batillaria attramentaria]